MPFSSLQFLLIVYMLYICIFLLLILPLYPQKLALTSPTSGGRSVGVVRLCTKATELATYGVLPGGSDNYSKTQPTNNSSHKTTHHAQTKQHTKLHTMPKQNHTKLHTMLKQNSTQNYTPCSNKSAHKLHTMLKQISTQNYTPCSNKTAHKTTRHAQTNQHTKLHTMLKQNSTQYYTPCSNKTAHKTTQTVRDTVLNEYNADTINAHNLACYTLNSNSIEICVVMKCCTHISQ
jgi:hypothetical protein